MSERPQPPIRAPLIPIDRAIVDENGRPTLDFWRAFEALRARLGGAEDLPFALAAYSENTAGQLSDISDRISRLEAAIAAKDAIDRRGLEDLERQLVTLAGRTDSVEASAQQSLEELQRRFSAAQAGFEQILLRPSGIDIVTDQVVASNAAINPSKLATISEETTTYENTTMVNSAWRLIMKLEIGNASQANQFFLDGSRILCNTSASADDTGVMNWEARIYDFEPTTAGDRTNGTQIDSGTINVSATVPAGNVSFWTPTTQFYTWRNSTVTYPTTGGVWIAFWGFVGTGPATEAYMDQVGLGTKIKFTSAFGFDKK